MRTDLEVFMKSNDILTGFELLIGKCAFVGVSLFYANHWSVKALLLGLIAQLVEGSLHLSQILCLDQIDSLYFVFYLIS